MIKYYNMKPKFKVGDIVVYVKKSEWEERSLIIGWSYVVHEVCPNPTRIKLTGLKYSHDVRCFTLFEKSIEMKKENKFKVGDEVYQLCTVYNNDISTGTKYVVLEIGEGAEDGTIRVKNEFSTSGGFYPESWFELLPPHLRKNKEEGVLKEGDEVTALKNIENTTGKWNLVSKGDKFKILSISEDKKWVTLDTGSGRIYSSSLFEKVKPKATMEIINIGSKNATITIFKEELRIESTSIVLDMKYIRNIYDYFNHAEVDGAYTFSPVNDVRFILVGCEKEDNRVSLDEIKKVLDIAASL